MVVRTLVGNGFLKGGAGEKKKDMNEMVIIHITDMMLDNIRRFESRFTRAWFNKGGK